MAAINETTKGVRIPRVYLGALRVLGGATAFTGAALTTYSAYGNYESGNYSGLALNAADLTVTTVGLFVPPALPLSIGYGISRALGDIGIALYNLDKPDLFEQAEIRAAQARLAQRIALAAGCP